MIFTYLVFSHYKIFTRDCNNRVKIFPAVTFPWNSSIKFYAKVKQRLYNFDLQRYCTSKGCLSRNANHAITIFFP